MTPFLPMMLDHMGTAMRATDTVAALLEDNISMVSSLQISDIQRFVDVYRTSQMPRFLNLLGRICVCREHPMVFVQAQIVQELIVRSPEILPWLEVVDGDVAIHLGETTTMATLYLETDNDIMMGDTALMDGT